MSMSMNLLSNEKFEDTFVRHESNGEEKIISQLNGVY